MSDGHRQRPCFGRTGEHHDAVADGVHRGAVGSVELDALMLLEGPAHGRAVAVGLIDVRLVLERSEEHTSELQSQSNLVCRLLLEKKKNKYIRAINHCSTLDTVVDELAHPLRD